MSPINADEIHAQAKLGMMSASRAAQNNYWELL